jgi:hypothetical protein
MQDVIREQEDLSSIIILRSEERGGMAISGYEDQTEIVVELLSQVDAFIQSTGGTFEFRINGGSWR